MGLVTGVYICVLMSGARAGNCAIPIVVVIGSSGMSIVVVMPRSCR
jgi:hypothetical protein